MASKVKSKTYNVMFKLRIDVGMNISAESLSAAIAQAEAFKIYEILDLKGLDHNDSDTPIVYGVFEA